MRLEKATKGLHRERGRIRAGRLQERPRRGVGEATDAIAIEGAHRSQNNEVNKYIKQAAVKATEEAFTIPESQLMKMRWPLP